MSILFTFNYFQMDYANQHFCQSLKIWQLLKQMTNVTQIVNSGDIFEQSDLVGEVSVVWRRILVISALVWNARACVIALYIFAVAFIELHSWERRLVASVLNVVNTHQFLFVHRLIDNSALCGRRSAYSSSLISQKCVAALLAQRMRLQRSILFMW